MATVRARLPIRPARLLATVCLAAAAAVLVPPGGVGVAEPRPSVAEVARQVAALEASARSAVEDFNVARIALDTATREVADSSARVAQEQARLSVHQARMGSVAAAAYRSGGTESLVTLLTSSTPQTFLDRAVSLDRIADNQADELQAITVARHRLALAEASARSELDRRRGTERELAAKRTVIEATLTRQKEILGSLRADEARALAAARAAADAREEAQAATVAARVSREIPATRATRASRSTRDSGTTVVKAPAGSGGGAIAVRAAYAQLGKPYSYGASGPNAFDCSGLTSFAWAQAGVSLPRSSRAQYTIGTRVSQSQLQPGDLIFYYSPISHVSLYVGGGMTISAPQTGDSVKIQSAFRSGYVGAVRP